LLAETDHITVTISEQGVAEAERAIARKAAGALTNLRQAIQATRARIVLDPSSEDVTSIFSLIAHPSDITILLAAMKAGTDYLVTLNRKYFLDDPEVKRRSGSRIGTPGDALNWIRGQLLANR
jgi:predicted nucleic acid-binding protein